MKNTKSFDKWLRSKITLPLWLRYKNMHYFNDLRGITSFHEKSIDEIKAIQFKRIKNIINIAYKNVPFYQNKWKRIGLTPEDIKSLQDIKNIPILMIFYFTYNGIRMTRAS